MAFTLTGNRGLNTICVSYAIISQRMNFYDKKYESSVAWVGDSTPLITNNN